MGLPDEVIGADRALSGRGIAGAISIRAVAAAVGVSPTTVLKNLREQPGYAPDEDGMIVVGKVLGLDGKVRPSRRFDTTARDERIRSMREDGKSIREIAAELGCSVGTVHRVLRRRPASQTATPA